MDLDDLLTDKTATIAELARLLQKGKWNDPGDTLGTLWAIIQTAESAARTAVEMIRTDETASWNDIGRAWGGITRQAAQQKWG